MNAFRVLALAYALVALMIAPGWLSADEQVPPAPAAAPDEQVAPATEPAPVVADDPPADAPASDPEVTVAEEPAEPTAVEETAVAEDDEAKPKPRPVAKAAASGSVTITDFEFSPSTITVNEGDTVTWTNQGPTPHTATAEDGSFDTGNLNKGQSGSATFTAAGTISYICTPHPFMTGKVIVQAAAAGDDDSGSTDDGGDDDDITAGSETAGESDTADDGSGLPNTGAETLIIALLGIATLGAGVLLRRRAT